MKKREINDFHTSFMLIVCELYEERLRINNDNFYDENKLLKSTHFTTFWAGGRLENELGLRSSLFKAKFWSLKVKSSILSRFALVIFKIQPHFGYFASWNVKFAFRCTKTLDIKIFLALFNLIKCHRWHLKSCFRFKCLLRKYFNL